MLTKIKKYAGLLIFTLASLTYLNAAGSYMEIDYNDYDAEPPKQPTESANLNISRHAFTGTTAGQSFFSGTSTLRMFYPSVFNNMSSESTDSTVVYDPALGKYTTNQYEITEKFRRQLSQYILPGYSATMLSAAEKGNVVQNMLYDLYPGSANILNNNSTVNISFKAHAKLEGTTFQAPFMDMYRITVNITVADGSTSPLSSSFYTYRSAGAGINGTGIDIRAEDNYGLWPQRQVLEVNDESYGLSFAYKFPTMNPGTKVIVRIEAAYASPNITTEIKTFTFMVEGVPFLQKIVSANTEYQNNGTGFKPQLYGWTADGGKDINGDGYPDLIVGDPYYRYSTTNVDGYRTGRVYVYFGAPDKILNATVTPDIIIENSAVNSVYSRDREFGYKVKLGDINNDGYADIIVGQPSYSPNTVSTNAGRILVYLGGQQYKNGKLVMETFQDGNLLKMITPSIVINNDRKGAQSLGEPFADDLFGAVFDVGDLNGDGYADIVAKIGNNENQSKNSIYLFSGSYLSKINGYGTGEVDLNPRLSRSIKTYTISDGTGGIYGKTYTNVDVLPASDVAIVGDVNRDGILDFAVSYPREDEGIVNNYSNVRIFFGNSSWGRTGASTDPSQVYTYGSYNVMLRDASAGNDYFGIALAAAGDINHDGYADIIVGKLTTDKEPRGKALIFLGRPLMNGIITYNGDNPDQSYPGIIAVNEPVEALGTLSDKTTQFGLKVAGIGDINEDGYDDMLIGAPYQGDSELGAVYLLMGSDFPDSIVGEDNLKTYVITGKAANAHYGMHIAPLGDFNQDGHADFLVSAPGFQGDRYFSGYPMPSGASNPVDRHTIDIYTNALGIDNALPLVLVNKLNPQRDQIGWDEFYENIDITFFDRGRAGLEFNSFSIDFVGLGEANTLAGGSILQGKKELGNVEYSKVGQNYILKNFWASEGNYKASSENFGTGKFDRGSGYYNSDFSKITGETVEGNKELYRYKKTPAFIGLGFALDTVSGNRVLNGSQDYSLRLRFSDRGGDTALVEFDQDRETVLTINIAANEPRRAAIIDNVPTDVGAVSTFVGIGDLDGDGIDEFALGDPKAGRVDIYWGTGGQNFSTANRLTILDRDDSDKPTVTNFGKQVVSARVLNVDQKIVDGLFILHDEGFYLFRGFARQYGQVSFNIAQDSGYFNPSSQTNEKISSLTVLKGIGVYADEGSATANVDFIAALHADKKHVSIFKADDRLYEDWIGKQNGNKIRLRDDGIEAGAIIGGYVLKNSTEAQLIVGFPAASSNRGEVIIYELKPSSDILFTLTKKHTIRNTELPGAQFGHALAAGFFESDLGSLGRPEKDTDLQGLAIGAPYAKINVNDDTGSGFVMVLKQGKLTADKNIHEIPTADYYFLTGDQPGAGFGYSLASLKYTATPLHQAKWSNEAFKDPFWDDADDLAVGAPYYKPAWAAVTNENANGKIYIYRGSSGQNGKSPFSNKPAAGYVSREQRQLGLGLANGGDVINSRSNMLAAIGSGASSANGKRAVHLILSGRTLDSTPPTLVSVTPEDREYEVPTNSAIAIKFSDMSGIDDSKLQIYRIMDGKYIPLVLNGMTVDNYETNGKKYFEAVTRDREKKEGLLDPEVEYILKLKDGYYWNQSEVVELEVTIADGRVVYTDVLGTIKPVVRPLYTTIRYGFVADYQANASVNVKEIVGKNTNSYFGSAVSYVGDVNKDGYPDFIVGEYGNNEFGWMAGKAYLYLGNKDLDTFTGAPAAQFTLGLGAQAEQANSAKFGWRVAPAGDMNGDGYDDVAVSAVNSSTYGGEVFILLGNPDPRTGIKENNRFRPDGPVSSIAWDDTYINFRAVSIKAAQPGDGLGYGLFGGGDINGDGYADLLIGAPYYDETGYVDTGRVYVIFGQPDMLEIYARNAYRYSSLAASYSGPIRLNRADYEMTGSTPGSFDPRLYPAAYIRNPELSLSAPQNNYAFFGYAVVSSININGDAKEVSQEINGFTVTKSVALSELLIGAPGYDNSRGKVYMYTGDGAYKVRQITAGELGAALEGENIGDKFGFSLSNLGDISADNNMNRGARASALIGHDFIVGAPGSDGPKTDYNKKVDLGAAYVYTAAPRDMQDFAVSKAASVYGQRSGDQFGYVVSTVGNVNNDVYGIADFAVGAPFFDVPTSSAKPDGAPNTGRVYIYGVTLKDQNNNNTNPDYQVVISQYPEQISTGASPYEFFGTAISYLGDLDDDFVPEYIVGAPGYQDGSGFGYVTEPSPNQALVGNRGRVYFYTNPDRVGPVVFDPLDTYVWPYPGDPKVMLASLVTSDMNPITPNLVYNRELKFRIFDDRAVNLDAVFMELRPEGREHVSRYMFKPSVNGQRYYTTSDGRKNFDFFLNIGSNFYWNTTYNVRIYATDMHGNPMEYYYDANDTEGGMKDPFAASNDRVPVDPSEYLKDPKGPEKYPYRTNYFQYSFATSSNPQGKPEVAKLNLLNRDGILSHNNYFGIKAETDLLINSTSGTKLDEIMFVVSPSGLLTADGLVFDVPFNHDETSYTRKVSVTVNALGGSPTQDGRFTLTAHARDAAGNVMAPFSRTFIKDVAAPQVIPVSPRAGSTNNADDCTINFVIVDLGTGLDILTANNTLDYTRFKVSIITTTLNVVSNATENVTIEVPTSQIAVSLSYVLSAEGTVAAPATADISLLGYKFAYEQQVTVQVSVSDNALHHTSYNYTYRVSPDYRAPAVPYDSEPKIWQGEYSTGEITLSLNALDDIGVKYVVVEVVDADNDQSLPNSTTLRINQNIPGVPAWNTASWNALPTPPVNPIRVPLYYTSRWEPTTNPEYQSITNPTTTNNALVWAGLSENYVTVDYQGVIGLEVISSGNAGNFKNGLRWFRVWFEDEHENRSRQAPTLSIVLQKSSDQGGPIMPILRVNHAGAGKVPQPDATMPLYFNREHRLVDFYLYAEDVLISPNADYKKEVLATVISGRSNDMDSSKPFESPIDNPTADRLLYWGEGNTKNGELPVEIDVYTRRPMRVVQGFDLDVYGDGRIDVYANFADNDAGLSMVSKYPKDSNDPEDTLQKFLFATHIESVDAQDPAVINKAGGVTVNNTHPLHNLASLGVVTSPNTAVHFSDEPAHLVLWYDNTPPVIDKLVAYGGRARGKGVYMANSYSRDPHHLQFEVEYADTLKLGENGATIDVYVDDIYYQIVGVSNNGTGNEMQIYVGAQGLSRFTDETYYNENRLIEGNHTSYDGTASLNVFSWVYAVPPERITLNADGLPEIKISAGDAAGSTVTLSGAQFVSDNFETYTAASVNMRNWTRLDVRQDQNYVIVELPVTLSADMLYYIRAVVKDKAGNFSPILNSNYVYIDNHNPEDPVFNYVDNIVLNRNKFDIDFMDLDAGLYEVRFSTGVNTPYNDIMLDGSAVASASLWEFTMVNNKQNYDYVREISANWKVPDGYWDGLSASTDAQSLYFLLTDAVNLNFSSLNLGRGIFKFRKDTLPLALLPEWNSSPNGVISFTPAGGEEMKFTQDDAIQINVVPAEAHYLVFTDVPYQQVIATDNIDDNLLFPDFSFERHGDLSIKKSQYLQLNEPDDLRVTADIVLLESAVDRGPVTGKSQLGANGNYALGVNFDINVDSENATTEVPYSWGGLSVTFAAYSETGKTAGADDPTRNYTVGVFLDTSLITDINNKEELLHYKGGYFGLVVEAAGQKVIAEQKMNAFASGAGESWKLLTVNVVIPPTAADKTVTLSIKHLDMNNLDTGKSTYDPWNIDKSYVMDLGVKAHAMRGLLLVDALYVVPGVAVTPQIFVSDNAQAMGYEYEFPVPESAAYNFTLLGYDRIGNLTTKNLEIIVDHTPPTWSIIPGSVDILVTRNEDFEPNFPNGTPTSRYLAFYQVPANGNGKDYQLERSQDYEKYGLLEAKDELSGYGKLYTNAYTDSRGYLAGHFSAQDLESPIQWYEYTFYREIPAGSGIYKQPGALNKQNAENKDYVNRLNYPVHINSFVSQMQSGDSWYIAARAANLFGMYSEWVSSDRVWIDVDPPLVTYEIDAGEMVTIDGKPLDSGWYRGPITVTVSALDILRLGKDVEVTGGIGWVTGGVGVQAIYVVTNNSIIDDTTALPYHLELTPLNPLRAVSGNELVKFITFNLTADGPNSFAVWAEDWFGQRSVVLSRNTDLYIDTTPPALEIKVASEYENKATDDLSKDPIWITSNVEFSLEYSDGQGVGTQKVLWAINGIAQDVITLNQEVYGQYGTRSYYDRSAGKFVTINLREGVYRGRVSRDAVLVNDPAGRELLLDAAILGLIGSPAWDEFYTWNPTNYEVPLYVDDRELYDRVVALGMAKNHEFDIYQIINLWRHNTTPLNNADSDETIRKLYPQVINDEVMKLERDGYHLITATAVDKFGRTSAVQKKGYFTIDRGAPDIQVNLGGSFQSQWSLEDITIKADVFDKFRDPVLVTGAYYPGIDFEDDNSEYKKYAGLEIKFPGSGVERVEFKIGDIEAIKANSVNTIVVDESTLRNNGIKKEDARFGFGINKNWGTATDLNHPDLIITRNGITSIAYQLFDYAGNASEQTIADGAGQWSDVLGSYVYVGDNGVIRGVKVDTLPPYELKLEIVTADSYTDTRPDQPDYPLYTRQDYVRVRFEGRDEGIGVRYAYFSSSQNQTPETISQGVRTFPDINYLQVDEWQDITRRFMADAPDTATNEHGIRHNYNSRLLWFGEKQGTRNLTMEMADDFGLNYWVSMSSIEQTSAVISSADYRDIGVTWNNPDTGRVEMLDTTYNYVTNPSLVDAGAYGVKGNDTDGYYFFWEGWLDVPDEYKYEDLYNVSGNPIYKDKPNAYQIKQVTLNAGTESDPQVQTMNVYLWDQEMPGLIEHRTGHVSSNWLYTDEDKAPYRSVTADRLIIYDNEIYMSNMGTELVITDNKLLIATGSITLPPGLEYLNGKYVNSNTINVEYVHDETDELSGITHIMFSGDVLAVGLLTANYQEVSANVWVTYNYRSAGLTNNYILTLKPPATGDDDGVLTVNIIAVRDRAGNVIWGDGTTGNKQAVYAGVPMHTVSFYYNRPLPRDNIESRYVIKTDEGMILNGNYYVGAPTYNIELNFRGAGTYEILEYLAESGVENSLTKNYYIDAADLDGKPGWKLVPGVRLTPDNRGDGMKYLRIRLYDLGEGNTPENSLTIKYDHFVDNTPPTLSIAGLEGKEVTWYSPSVTAQVTVTDNGSGIASIVYRINTQTPVTHSYAYDSSERYPRGQEIRGILFNETNQNNKLSIKVLDGVGNVTNYLMDNIKVNANPPHILEQYAVRPEDGTVQGNKIYTNKRALPIKISGYGATTLNLSGAAQYFAPASRDYAFPSTDGYYTVNMLALNGTRNLTVKGFDEMTGYGGPASIRNLEIALDTKAPNFTVSTQFTAPIVNVSDELAITGNIYDDPAGDGSDYASGADVYYQIAGISGELYKADKLDDTTWAIRIKDVLRQANRKNNADGVPFRLRVTAKDKASNPGVNDSGAAYEDLQFTLHTKYVMTARSMGLDIQEVSASDPGVANAAGKLKGVAAVPGLDDTMARFTITGNVTENPLLILSYGKEAADAAAQLKRKGAFRIYALNEATAEWVQVPGQDDSSVDKTHRTVAVTLSASSKLAGMGVMDANSGTNVNKEVYRLFYATDYADDLKEVRMYPNPYKGSDDDWRNGDDDNVLYNKITLDNITETTRVRIYTISGELVQTLEADKTYIEWDLTNSLGGRVASGVYIVLMTDSDNNKHIGRLTVVR